MRTRAFLRDGGIIHRLTFRIDAKTLALLAMTCTSLTRLL